MNWFTTKDDTRIYEGAGHGLPTRLKGRLNADLLEFGRARAAAAA
jgi:hypothetical protein